MVAPYGMVSVLVACGFGCGAPPSNPAGSDASGDAAVADTGGDAGGIPLLSEPFPGSDGDPWPAGWTVLGGVANATVEAGAGRIVPQTSAYAVGRIGHALGARDVEVSFLARFDDVGTQGIGLYVRQNGGWLTNTATHGAGYVLFVEGFRGSRLGLWREVDGTEIEIVNVTSFGFTLASNEVYALRFQCTQQDASTTRLRGRIWRASDPEPATWQLETTDTTPSLQNVSGDLAVDSYTSATSGSVTAGTSIDDLLVVAPVD